LELHHKLQIYSSGRIEKDEVASRREYFRKKHGEKEEKNEHEE
jgi:hypothetical protein